MFYLDTSILVASITQEPGSDELRKWLGSQETGDLSISDWVVAEFSSALSLKLRTGQIDLEQRAAALASFSTISMRSMVILSINSQHFRAAAGFADAYESGVRAGDALHLAIAAHGGATLCTRDKKLADAGPALGVATHLF